MGARRSLDTQEKSHCLRNVAIDRSIFRQRCIIVALGEHKNKLAAN